MNLNQITIKSTDVNRSMAFYKKLGLQLIVDSSPRYVRFVCPQGGSTFSVSHASSVPDAATVVYFEVAHLDLVHKNLTAQGIDFTSAPEDKPWLWREAGLRDPDGQPLILFTAGINRINPPWKLWTKRWFEYLAESPVNLMK